MLNNVTLMGRLTADPVVRYTHANNIPVANFSVAVDRRLIKGRERETDFFNIVAWQGTADFVSKYFTKGQPICVEGRLQQRTWTDEATGTNRSVIEVIAEGVHFAGFKKDDTQNNNAGYNDEFDPYEEPVAA